MSYYKSINWVYVPVPISHNMAVIDMPSLSWNTSQWEQNDKCSERCATNGTV